MLRVRRILVLFVCTLLAASAFASGTLFGLRNPGEAGRQEVRIDVATAGITAVGVSVAPPLGTASGVSALDGPGNRFFFVGTPSGDPSEHVYTVDTGSGALTASPAIAAGAAILGMAY